MNKFFTPGALHKIHQQNDGRQALAATFKLLNIELEAIYGRPIDWVQVIEPASCPEDTLRQYLQEAQIGEDPDGVVLWQTVLHQTFPFIRKWYLNLTDQDRKRFDRDYTSAFFTHVATQPRMNA